MRKISYLLVLITVAFAACKDGGYTKGGEGMEYKIIADGSGEKIKPGQYVEFEMLALLKKGTKDSILSSSRELGAPQIMMYDSNALPPQYFKIFAMLRKGDSLSTRVSTDSLFKKDEGSMPPFMAKGQMLYTNIRITNIYKTREEADKAREAAMLKQEELAKVKNAEQAKTDDKLLNEYFAKNNIKPVKTAKGVYVQIIQQGTGPLMDTTNFTKVNYTGRTLEGIMFDSNTDPAKGHVEPLTVNLTPDYTLGNTVIPGFSEGLRMLNPGSKAKIFIPSGLAYGRAGNGGEIKPNTIIVFDIDVLSMMTKAQAAAEREIAQKKMEEMQKRYVDSLKAAQPAQAK